MRMVRDSEQALWTKKLLLPPKRPSVPISTASSLPLLAQSRCTVQCVYMLTTVSNASDDVIKRPRLGLFRLCGQARVSHMVALADVR